MRRVVEMHKIAVSGNTCSFTCTECDIVFESDEYGTEENNGITSHYDYCPLCGVGTFVKENVYVRQDTA